MHVLIVVHFLIICWLNSCWFQMSCLWYCVLCLSLFCFVFFKLGSGIKILEFWFWNDLVAILAEINCSFYCMKILCILFYEDQYPPPGIWQPRTFSFSPYVYFRALNLFLLAPCTKVEPAHQKAKHVRVGHAWYIIVCGVYDPKKKLGKL